MTKVCHMTSAHQPEDERIFFKEAVSLAKNGYETYLVCRGEHYEKNGVHIVGVGQPAGGRFSRMTTFARRIYQVALELDAEIYHFHDPELLPYGLKKKKKGKQVIFDSHEKYSDQILTKKYLPGPVAKLIGKLYEQYENFVLRRLDAAIFPCTLNGQNPFEGKCRRSEIIANHPIFSEFYDKYRTDWPKNEKSVCYVGGLTENRGITNSMEGAYQAHATLYLAGRFSPADYQQQLMEKEAYQCIAYQGFLSREKVADLIASCNIGLYLLKDVGQYLKLETMGIKVYEYMSMGLPVIMSHSPYNDWLAEQYQFAICVDPENVQEIADTIRYLLGHPDEARRMGECGRRAIKQYFNWDVEEKKLLTLYDTLVSSKEQA